MAKKKQHDSDPQEVRPTDSHSVAGQPAGGNDQGGTLEVPEKEPTTAPESPSEGPASVAPPATPGNGGKRRLGQSSLLPPAADESTPTVAFESAEFADETAVTFVLSDNPHADTHAPTVLLSQEADETPLHAAQGTGTISMQSVPDPQRDEWKKIIQESRGAQTGDVSLSGLTSRIGTETNLVIQMRKLTGMDEELTGLTDYRLLKQLGKGGMGTVYLAHQTSLDRNVALKVINPFRPTDEESLAKTGHLDRARKLRRDQFLSEAVVTGDLDHPNIVPIHDVGLTEDDRLFYSMKRVEGTKWERVLRIRSLRENLEIWLKVADAVAFAHSRGVVHRDIKPENVMLGDFGVVMLVDWGLAVPTEVFEKHGSVRQTTSLGGSPAYMAPELAIGPISKITPASDIYLLGAVIYEIITGRPPHTGGNISECLQAARMNRIQPIEADHEGELMTIARRAMATMPEDRYPSVQALQSAVRDYISHSDSIALADAAEEEWAHAERSQEYRDYARAVFGFEEAINLWPDNARAKQGLRQSRLGYAEAAHVKEDYDLGLSLLDPHDPSHEPVIARLEQGQRERATRQKRINQLKKTAIGLAAAIFIGGSTALGWIYTQKVELEKAHGTRDSALAEAEAERIKADEARNEVTSLENDAKELTARADALKAAADEAESAKVVADRAKETAIKERDAQVLLAEQSKEAARQAQIDAEAAKTEVTNQMALAQQAQEAAMFAEENAQRAQRNAELAQNEETRAKAEARDIRYTAQIMRASAQIEANEFTNARQSLEAIRQEFENPQDGLDPVDVTKRWEWRRLIDQAGQAKSEQETSNTPRGAAFAPSGRRAVVTMEGGAVRLLSVDPSGRLQAEDAIQLELPAGVRDITASAFSPDDSQIAVAGGDGAIWVCDADSGKLLATLTGHTNRVLCLAYAPDGRLASGSADRTLRLWNPNSHEEVAHSWHLGAVRDVGLAMHDGRLIAVCAVSDDRGGRVNVWRLKSDAAGEVFERAGDFLGHDEDAPVLTVAINSDGTQAASGDINGHVLVWNPTQVDQLDYDATIRSAVSLLEDTNISIEDFRRKFRNTAKFNELTDLDPDDRNQITLTPVGPDASDAKRAHVDVVRSLAFSRDGKTLVSGADDYLLKIWDVNAGKLVKTLRGHGGRVRAVAVSPENANHVLSVAEDKTVRMWDVASYAARPVFDATESSGQQQAHEDQILSASFNGAGTQIVTASRDRTARIIDIDRDTLSFRRSVELNDVHGDSKSGTLDEGSRIVAFSVAVHEANRRLYTGFFDSTIRVWDLERGTELQSVRGTGLNTSFALSDDGRLLLTGNSRK
ncbi:MAG: protein kinase, partial [Planctomycetaceae bacterium]|nr:protein kinase [Planctomycetaceae bacterium]